jgi:phosphatidylinositol 4-kinase
MSISVRLSSIVAACTDRGKRAARPGGVKFEPSSFKLNHEMVVLMGGRNSQGYALFQQLCVAAFLALRPHAPQLIATVQLMLDTGLPSFKGEGTIRRLRDRFALGLSERHAADFMMAVVKNAHENLRSTVYDEFQRVSVPHGLATGLH